MQQEQGEQTQGIPQIWHASHTNMGRLLSPCSITALQDPSQKKSRPSKPSQEKAQSHVLGSLPHGAVHRAAAVFVRQHAAHVLGLDGSPAVPQLFPEPGVPQGLSGCQPAVRVALQQAGHEVQARGGHVEPGSIVHPHRVGGHGLNHLLQRGLLALCQVPPASGKYWSAQTRILTCTDLQPVCVTFY